MHQHGLISHGFMQKKNVSCQGTYQFDATYIQISSKKNYILFKDTYAHADFPCGSDDKESVCNSGDPCVILRLGRFPGERNGNPFQYSCLENSMDRGAWRAIVHGTAKSWT